MCNFFVAYFTSKNTFFNSANELTINYFKAKLYE